MNIWIIFTFYQSLKDLLAYKEMPIHIAPLDVDKNNTKYYDYKKSYVYHVDYKTGYITL